ncbi:MAG: radical SAM protein [Thermodesulfobacteriota bacterium]
MGGAPYIVPVFLPHAGCKNRCSYCSQETATGFSPEDVSPESARRRIEEGLALSRRPRERTEIAYYGANFLSLPPEMLAAHLAVAQEFISSGRAHAVRFSTRPDSICESSLAQLSGCPVSVIELGAQSMDDAVLAACRRGHAAEDTIRAAGLVKKAGIALGLHLMAGLPGESHGSFLSSVRAVAALLPDLVRIHPCLVLAKSALAHELASGTYTPLSLSEAVVWVADAFSLFREAGIPLARMGLLLPPGADPARLVLAGPYHPAFGELVLSEVFLRKARAALNAAPPESRARLAVHPRSLSRMLGHRRQNIRTLCRELGLSAVTVSADPSLDEFSVRLVP